MDKLTTSAPTKSSLDSSSPQVREAKYALDGLAKTAEKNAKPERTMEKALGALSDPLPDSNGFNLLLDGVNSLLENLPSLVKALDEVAKLHPFVSVAVGAFKIVIELEVKRRDNDRKVNLLFLEMKSMMSTILQLQNVRASHVARDGLTVGMRLDGLMKQIAEDIKECANACDTYSKKRLLVKVLKGSSWNEKLQEYVQRFIDRKAEIAFAVSVHTGIAIDGANDKLDGILTRLDVIVAYFDRVVLPDQQPLLEIVRKAGGPEKALADPSTMEDLLRRENRNEEDLTNPTWRPVRTSLPQAGTSASPWMYDYSRSAEAHRSCKRSAENRARVHTRVYASPTGPMYCPGQSSRTPGAFVGSRAYVMPTSGANPVMYSNVGARGSYENVRSGSYDLHPTLSFTGMLMSCSGYVIVGSDGCPSQEQVDLQQELADAPSIAIGKNFEAFERKFKILQLNMMSEIRDIVAHQGDRVITSVLDGPHEKIIDPDLYEIWKDMRWRGIVKARHLVLAIHDYYMQKLDDLQRIIKSNRDRPMNAADEWTLNYIDLMHIQPIIEALDEDASGFVSISEVNRFTISRPKGWSLLRWLAYWAVGWQVSMASYRYKITALLTRISATMRDVRSLNNSSVEKYYENVKQLVNSMSTSFQHNADLLPLLPRFQDWIELEEERMRKALETVNYDLDELNTVALVNGRQGLERNIFPILYLLLSRHYDVVKIAKSYILHQEEFLSAEAAIRMIHEAVSMRTRELSVLFYQRRLDVSREMDEHACGILSGPPHGYCATVPMSGDEVLVPENNDCPSTNILKFPPAFEDFYPTNDDGLHDQQDRDDVAEAVKAVLGRWTGRRSPSAEPITSGMVRPCDFTFHTTDSPDEFTAIPLLQAPWTHPRSEFVGTYTKAEDGTTTYSIKRVNRWSDSSPEFYSLALSPDGGTLVGVCGSNPDLTGLVLPVCLKKDFDYDIMAFYPTSQDLDNNKPRALWRFASRAVLNRIRARNFSWEYVRDRMQRRRTLAAFIYRSIRGPPLQPSDEKIRLSLVNSSTPADLHLAAAVTVDQERYPIPLLFCSGAPARCSRVIPNTVPLITSFSETYYDSPLHICDDFACLFATMQEDYWSAVLKTRRPGWTSSAFTEQALGMSIRDLGSRTAHLKMQFARATAPRFPQPEPYFAESSLGENACGVRPLNSPQSGLSTISERSGPDDDEVPRRSCEEELGVPNDRLSRVRRQESLDSQSHRGVSLDDQFPARPTCLGCASEVSSPCWMCAECQGHIFVCYACDARERDGVFGGAHKGTHALLNISPTPIAYGYVPYSSGWNWNDSGPPDSPPNSHAPSAWQQCYDMALRPSTDPFHTWQQY
ncbi:uncharacterized protein BXZ73DRAFT_41008 [Epithele typhae]|uniref:uncharacterized protein n=1 Tax=Epithele typhae TaxID=378194 RepID=UPI0020087AD4|nr:uncharacterized protein BXZ73DRAFT_41008 [Epithele typhae]KAH9942219.1 hypothetical protein BXZ73DRAFT_41008 [Epithele typhae]